ncbi:pyruvate, phosphate dikinase [Ahrensia sp. R2A130]|uniref:pyruvate, phosphate dikinase n=1 Tax=Ahrensia sp. R2A130 TaxID=744979 RepID=UPI0001E0D87A|nr:pyruvate, phosphate dikinase [Ahrensia sp. R2A130]EFL88906.1 pyruvate, phosphate dikinase [Ahrensia sp. R2A130]
MSDLITPFALGLDMPQGDPSAHGVKGANLMTMAQLDLPVPPGFVISTALGRDVSDGADELPKDALEAISAAISTMEENLQQGFGTGEKPLLLSVRSGAAISMPGMMDTVLNLGFNDVVADCVAKITGDERFAWDTYRRFIASFAQVVLECDPYDFEDMLDDLRVAANVETDAELPTERLREAVERSFAIVEATSGEPFPQDVHQQLRLALLAVFRSWNTDRAKRYRELQNLDDTGGTAAIVQAMVFGNRNSESCTGVYFTRNPSTGDATPYGEWLPNAQGEDVVSGMRTPCELTEVGRDLSMSSQPSFEAAQPSLYKELLGIGAQLERHFLDMQEIEFTVESGTLYMLQTRTGKRTPKAALAVAVGLVEDGIISRSDALSRCSDDELSALQVAKVEVSKAAKPLAKGLPASPGAVTGAIALTSEDAVAMAAQGEDAILVRAETDPRDVHGMHAAIGILTSRGGMTSHAAVVARSMAKACITAALDVAIDIDARRFTIGDHSFAAGDIITIDGATGQVYAGPQPLVRPKADGALAKLLEWRDGNDG